MGTETAPVQYRNETNRPLLVPPEYPFWPKMHCLSVPIWHPSSIPGMMQLYAFTHYPDWVNWELLSPSSRH